MARVRDDDNDVYEEPKVLHLSGGTVIVHVPILTPEERERRMKRIREAATALVLAARSENNSKFNTTLMS